jgi:hypothetical protein
MHGHVLSDGRRLANTPLPQNNAQSVFDGVFFDEVSLVREIVSFDKFFGLYNKLI